MPRRRSAQDHGGGAPEARLRRATSRACRATLLAAAICAGCGRSVVDSGPRSLPPAPESALPPSGPILLPPTAGAGSGVGSHSLPTAPQVPASAVVPQTPRSSVLYHEVAGGETLSTIARRYGTSVETLLDANGLDPGVVLQPGQRLYVPGAHGPRPASDSRTLDRR